MKRKIAIILSLATFSCASNPQNSGNAKIDEVGGLPNGYELAWSDEFNQDGLPDAKKWQYDYANNKEGWYNDEKQ